MRQPARMATDQFAALEALIASRKSGDPDASYVARLFTQGRAKIAQKLGEEAVETVIAATSGNDAAIVPEAADLVFHLLVLLSDAGLSLDHIRAELARRGGLSGLEEKAQRS
jgi:phosphoribosyl-ATP pyrophosphohydrolase